MLGGGGGGGAVAVYDRAEFLFVNMVEFVFGLKTKLLCV